MGAGNNRDDQVFVCTRPRFNCVKKFDGSGRCRATASQRTTVSRLFQFAAYQKKSVIRRIGDASQLNKRMNSVSA